MFISQVLFESTPENKRTMEKILNVKRTQLEGAEGLLASEFWWRETGNSSGFSMVTKWQAKEDFQLWMKESHKGGHKRPEGADIEINKTAYQFDFVD